MSQRALGGQFNRTGLPDMLLNSDSPFLIGVEALYPDVDPHRGYEPLNMSTAKWQQIAPTEVPLDDIVAGQLQLTSNKIRESGHSYSGDDYPCLVRYQGRLHIEDGHHRVTAAIIAGKDTVMARVKDSGR